MIKNILTHWRTSLPGFTALVTSLVTLGAMIINHNANQAAVIASLTGAFTGLGLLFSQDYTQGAKAHAESQAQIAELQLRSNIVPNAIESGDTSQLRRVPMTPAAVPPPPIPPVANQPQNP
jgi:hypothetical protein